MRLVEGTYWFVQCSIFIAIFIANVSHETRSASLNHEFNVLRVNLPRVAIAPRKMSESTSRLATSLLLCGKDRSIVRKGVHGTELFTRRKP